MIIQLQNYNKMMKSSLYALFSLLLLALGKYTVDVLGYFLNLKLRKFKKIV